MDKFKAMQVFVTIADKGSLTGAAEHLNTSLTSVVRTLAALENHLEVRLFHRTTRSIVITDEGREYYTRCQTILAEVTEAESRLTDRQTEPQGKVTVTAPVTFGKRHVMPKISQYLSRYPKMQVDLLLLDRPVDMLSEGVDVAVRIGRIGNHNLVARQLGTMRHVLCASPVFLSAHQSVLSPDSLNGLPAIHLSVLESPSEWMFTKGGKSQKIALSSRLTTNQVDAALEACVSGVGFCRFLHYQVAELVQAGKLVIVLPDYEPHPLPVHLLYAPVKLQTKRLRTMTDWLTGPLQQDLIQIAESGAER